MNLGNLRTVARAQVPGAKKTRISVPLLDIILNNGKDDVATKTICLPANQQFNIIAVSSGIAEYDLTTVVTRFLVMDRPGLWYLDGGEYIRLRPKTIKWLDENRPRWRNESPGTPREYYQNGNTLGIVPAPSAAVTAGGWLYFGQRPADMTQSGHYPFGSSSEISRLIPLQQAILVYARWQMKMILNKGVDEYRSGENAYLREVSMRKAEITRRADITASRNAKYGGPTVC